ncbi:putative acetylxylan esterase A [Hymenopellis radicata]|nr:putative acetylxylan esterase A [Hymenopellis radicata]
MTGSLALASAMKPLSALVCFLTVVKSATAVTVWGQCGGDGYSGDTICDADTSCIVVNQWYYQCQPGNAASTTTVSSTATSTSAGSTPTSGGSIPRGALTQITDFGSNPTNVKNYVYVPNALKASPPLLIGIHWCGGTASDFFQVGFQYLAEQYGFIVLYPETPISAGCWDVHTNETLTHDAGGDSLGLINGARYLIDLFDVDTDRVFATGLSSGAMMTNVLAGAYPDVIRGGSVWAGVPYACFAGEGEWNTECALGETIKTPQEWGDLARGGYPGYTGPRPKMQLWHGTNDTTLYVQNFYEEVKQWTNVFNVSQTPTEVTENWPLPNWTKSDYGPNVQAVLATGETHGIQMQLTQIIEWMGLNQ